MLNKSILSGMVLLCTLLLMTTAHASPRIQQWQTTNGAQVYFVESNELPIVDIRVLFDAGSARDEGQAGVAVLTNALLAEGAADKNAQQLAEQFEDVGAQFSNGALRDMAWLSLRSLRDDRYLTPALNTLRAVLTRPTFGEEAFQRELSRMQVAWQASRQSPASIAEEAFYKALYGDHPYASPVNGTEQSLAGMQRQQVIDFYQRYYNANNAVIAIVGQLSREQAELLADSLIGQLPKGAKVPDLPPVKPLGGPKTVKIEFPSTQTHIYIGQPGMKRGDKDYFTLYVANHPFGGSGFASRLVDEIREKRGLAYSVVSYFLPSREPGPFMINMQTRNDQTDEAIQLLNEQLQTYVQTGPTADELESSIKNITGGFPLRIDSNKKITEYLAMIGFYGLPLDYLHNFNRRVSEVTRDEITQVLSQRLSPANMITVIVGGKAQGG